MVEEDPLGISSSRAASPGAGGAVGAITADRWQPRRDSRLGHTSHGRQKSLSEALRTIRTRKGSVSQHAHEIADALKAPLSPKLIMLCGVWYMTSIFTNMSSKAILTALPRPITLTTVQFAFVSGWCLVLAAFARKYPRIKYTMPFLKYGIRPPSKELVLATLPLTCFQIGGHILSADATSRIPVSLVHTIKGLSPLLTVLAYSLFFKIQYSTPTYLSLIPLTVGVVLACSADFHANLIGLLSAFASAILFVVQNIVSKQLFNDAAAAERDGVIPGRFVKPDKLNLLCYSSGLAFLFTLPLWFWSEGFTLLSNLLHDASIELSDRPEAFDHGRLALEYLFNGTFHFGQNIVAFILLSMISPVTYSVASLIKRVFVIVFAVVWFGKPLTKIQAFGLVLTFLGLYLYDRTSDASKADKRAKAMQSRSGSTLLPLAADVFTNSPPVMNGLAGVPLADISEAREEKRSDEAGYQRPSEHGSGYLPPGTKQDETWRPHEVASRRSLGI